MNLWQVVLNIDVAGTGDDSDWSIDVPLNVLAQGDAQDAIDLAVRDVKQRGFEYEEILDAGARIRISSPQQVAGISLVSVNEVAQVALAMKMHSDTESPVYTRQ